MSDLEFQTGWERYRIPFLLTGGLALYGASRFDATRAVAGVLLTYGFPLMAVAFGVIKLRDTALFAPALAVGSVAAVSAELAIGHAMAPELPVFGIVAPHILVWASALAAVGAVVMQAVAAGRGLRNFFAAWVGMVTMLALYMPAHAKVGRDSLDAFVAALIVSLFVGGGAGMLLGGLATRLVKGEPAAAEKPAEARAATSPAPRKRRARGSASGDAPTAPKKKRSPR